MGVPKGLLRRGGETLVERAVRVAREAGLEPRLLGEASAYAGLVPDVPRVGDRPAGVGPLGGLRALLGEGERVVSLAVDMPFVDASLLSALVAHPSEADVLLPRRTLWEPLCARWTSAAVCPVLDELLDAGERSLQRLVSRLRAEELVVAPELLDDWDTPADLDGAR